MKKKKGLLYLNKQNIANITTTQKIKGGTIALVTDTCNPSDTCDTETQNTDEPATTRSGPRCVEMAQGFGDESDFICNQLNNNAIN